MPEWQQILSAGTKPRHFVPEWHFFFLSGTESHQNVPACARVGTLRHQNVPGRQQIPSVGTKMHRNVPRRELSLLRGTGATIFITFVNYGNTIWS